MNIPASMLSENYKSMQEHDDKIIWMKITLV